MSSEQTEGLEALLGRLRESLGGPDAEDALLAGRLRAAEQQLFTLMQTQVLMARLQGTLERAEVHAAIQDVVVNLVGSEEVAILETGVSPGRLELTRWSGAGAAPLAHLVLDEGPLGLACAQGTVSLAGDRSLAGGTRTGQSRSGERAPSACVPLRLGTLLVGAVLLYRLLPHKERLTEADRTLLTQLGAQAATALYCAQLHERLHGGGR